MSESQSDPEIFDLLVIGGGIAGGTAALTAADQGFRVLALVKSADPEDTATDWAQGGIVADGNEDPPELLVEDILEAGDRIGWDQAAMQLAEFGPKLVHEFLLDRLGVPFDRNLTGELHHTAEAAHSVRRILHVGDRTGQAIQQKLTEALRAHPGIQLAPRSVAIDLITRSHHDPDPSHAYLPDRVLGAYVLEEDSGRVRTILSRATVLATGGMGQIFLHTTNPTSATGDGFAMAARAGLPLRNLEYVQFHPTAFFSPKGERFLISEAVRGEGAWLINDHGERFMERFAPRQLELAPRDEVARAIHEEMSSTGHPSVYLDLANHHGEGVDIPTRFPQIFEFLKARHLDLSQDPVPVVPAAHYACGGVLVGLTGRVPNIRGLYAVGEVSCTGLHGANRLASTSLLEGLVWGWRAGTACKRDIEEGGESSLTPVYARIPAWDSSGCQEEPDPVLFLQDWNSIRHITWNYAGIVRTKRRLKRAVDDLGYLSHRVERFYRSTRMSRPLLELRNAVLVARCVAQSAQRNPQSYGCHFVRD
jgi:L-aspartate oxidase